MQTLNTQGVAIPRLGLGTFRATRGACQPMVESALALGYRHIDTAAMYENEAEIGAAIAASGVPRGELFVATKVWHDQLAPDAMLRAIDASLNKLRLAHVDLYMVHWPAPAMDMAASLNALVGLHEAGLARSIGVSNFNLPMLRHAVEQLGVPLAAHQIEYHAFLDQSAMLGYLRSKGIALTAYAPLAQGRAANDATLARIAAKHGASAGQIAIAWLLEQEGVVAIPKASRPQTQQANLAAAAIRLDADDRAAIAALPKDQRFVNPSFAPDWGATACAG